MLIPASSISFLKALSPVSPVDGGLIVWGLCVFGMCVGLGGVVLGSVGWVPGHRVAVEFGAKLTLKACSSGPEQSKVTFYPGNFYLGKIKS